MLEKYREGEDTYALDLDEDLGDAETLENPVVQVLPGSSGVGSDVTAEFVTVGAGNPAVDGIRLLVRLNAAAAGKQARGSYRLKARAKVVGSARVVATEAVLVVK